MVLRLPAGLQRSGAGDLAVSVATYVDEGVLDGAGGPGERSAANRSPGSLTGKGEPRAGARPSRGRPTRFHLGNSAELSSRIEPSRICEERPPRGVHPSTVF